jgi:pilus assembly protein CpaE
MSILLETDPFLVRALSPAISPDTVVVPDLVALRRLLVDDPRHELVVIGPDVEMSLVTDFTSGERVARPALGVVLVRRRLDTAVLKEALKAGVREVVKLDDLTGLTQACGESREVTSLLRGTAPDVAASPAGLGRLVTVFSAKGGCGKTTLATNLAAACAKRGHRVCLVDLDLAFGDVAIALQLFPERGLADLAATGGALDRSSVASVVTPHSPRFDTLLAPVEPGVADTISAALVGDLLQCLKSMYDVVVVDTPPAFTDQVLTAFDASDHLALVTTLDIPALKNLKLTLETLELLGYARERWNVVLNRADSKVGLAVESVERTLRVPISAQVPSSRAVPAAVNRGVAIVQDAPSHAVSTSIRAFADRLLHDVATDDSTEPAPARKLGLHRRRRAVEVPA